IRLTLVIERLLSVSRLQTLFLFDSRRSTGLVITACTLSLHNFSAEKETYDRFLALAEHEHRPISEILQDFIEDYILKHDIKKIRFNYIIMSKTRGLYLLLAIQIPGRTGRDTLKL
ncbi:MAG: hypothetical protein WCA39_09930, partial [Nitrososphaeraceae archaeon]